MVMQNSDDPAATSLHSDVAITGSVAHKIGKEMTTPSTSMSKMELQNLINTMERLELGTYQRELVSNISSTAPSNDVGRQLFDTGLRLMMAYQHEMAALYFHACIEVTPQAALAHGLMALCHGPNYNFKGELYYHSSNHEEDRNLPDLQCAFPSQQVADRHSAAAMAIIEELQHPDQEQQRDEYHESNNQGNNGDMNDKGNDSQHSTTTESISDVEVQLLSAIRILMGTPGVDPNVSDELVGRPFANAMRDVYRKYPDDPDMAYFFAEALMVLNAWQLYEYPSGKALSADVEEIREVLERALQNHPHHPGLLHLYAHLSEMSSQPERALSMCEPLRTMFPHAGHLIHMQTHIDVLLGHYDACVRSNLDAIRADMYTMQISPSTAGRETLYFGYIVVRRAQCCWHRTCFFLY